MIAASIRYHSASRTTRNVKPKDKGKGKLKKKDLGLSVGSITDKVSKEDSNFLKVTDLGANRKRAGSVPAIRFTLATVWGIKSSHVKALKLTWCRLCDTPRSNCKGIVAIIEKVLEKLETKDKSVKEVFYNSAFVDSIYECAGRYGKRQSCPSLNEQRRLCSGHSHCGLRDHIHFFVSLIDSIINALDEEPHEILAHISKIATFHAGLKQYGFKFSTMDCVGELLLDSLVVQEAVRCSNDGCRAWTILLATLIDKLRSPASNAANGGQHFCLLSSTGNLTQTDSLINDFKNINLKLPLCAIKATSRSSFSSPVSSQPSR